MSRRYVYAPIKRPQNAAAAAARGATAARVYIVLTSKTQLVVAKVTKGRHIFKICSLDGSQPETQTQTQTTAESATARRPPHTQYHAVDIVDVDVAVDVAVVGDLWERALSAEQQRQMKIKLKILLPLFVFFCSVRCRI